MRDDVDLYANMSQPSGAGTDIIVSFKATETVPAGVTVIERVWAVYDDSGLASASVATILPSTVDSIEDVVQVTFAVDTNNPNTDDQLLILALYTEYSNGETTQTRWYVGFDLDTNYLLNSSDIICQGATISGYDVTDNVKYYNNGVLTSVIGEITESWVDETQPLDDIFERIELPYPATFTVSPTSSLYKIGVTNDALPLFTYQTIVFL